MQKLKQNKGLGKTVGAGGMLYFKIIICLGLLERHLL